MSNGVSFDIFWFCFVLFCFGFVCFAWFSYIINFFSDLGTLLCFIRSDRTLSLPACSETSAAVSTKSGRASNCSSNSHSRHLERYENSDSSSSIKLGLNFGLAKRRLDISLLLGLYLFKQMYLKMSKLLNGPIS